MRTPPTPRSAASTFAWVGLLLFALPLALPSAVAEYQCPGTLTGLAARPGTQGAVSIAKPDDATFMSIPVVPAQRTQVYIRIAGALTEPGDVVVSYQFDHLKHIDGAPYVWVCDRLVTSGSFTIPDLQGPSTLVIERPIYVTEQNLDTTFHITVTGMEVAAWEVEFYPCGNGGWLC